jgi:hypothetical protein
MNRRNMEIAMPRQSRSLTECHPLLSSRSLCIATIHGTVSSLFSACSDSSIFCWNRSLLGVIFVYSKAWPFEADTPRREPGELHGYRRSSTSRTDMSASSRQQARAKVLRDLCARDIVVALPTWCFEAFAIRLSISYHRHSFVPKLVEYSLLLANNT